MLNYKHRYDTPEGCKGALMTRKKFNVTGLTCSACSAHVEKAVSKVPGVQSVAVSLLTNTMQVQYDEGATNPDAIIAAVVKAGYGDT